jgi:hypothetical protein
MIRAALKISGSRQTIKNNGLDRLASSCEGQEAKQ